MSEWQPNTGVIPDGIDSSTWLRVRYVDGFEGENDAWCNANLWQIKGDNSDITHWRFAVREYYMRSKL